MKKITIDGNTACAMSMYATNEVAIIYPITPSSPMAEACDEWASSGKKNIFDTTMKVVEMQSEGGASGALHGSLVAGSLTTTFTASQGLLLMIPNMYKIAGELLPCVINVSARALATHALSIFGDQSDVMACRQTGFAMLCSNNVQEAHDFATIAMMATLKSSVPFLHFFDGFRTSHEINNIEVLENEDIHSLMPLDKIKEFKARAMSPNHPNQRGTSQNPDVFFQNREANEPYYRAVLDIIKECMAKYAVVSNRHYAPYEYVGAKDATKVVVVMGSASETLESVVKYLNKNANERVGVLKVRLYRPFFAHEFCKALPKTTQFVTVLDRTKESGQDAPLYLDVVNALNLEKRLNNIIVLGGRYGLGGKDFTPSDAIAVFQNCKKNGKNHFTVGITDDLCNTNLVTTPFLLNNNLKECMFYGLGSDGTVSANKNSIKIIGDNTNLNAQGYFVYDSKKSGSVTISHLRFGKSKIQAPYEISNADFIACHNQRFVGKYDILKKIKNGGTFLLNTNWSNDELKTRLPQDMIKTILDKHIRFFIIDADDIARQIGLKGKINTIMQSAFFKLTNIMPYKNAVEAMKIAAKKSYGKAGDAVVQQNYDAIDFGGQNIKQIKVDTSWLNNDLSTTKESSIKNDFAKNIMEPIAHLDGNSLPTSAFDPRGIIPSGTAKFEKRGIAPAIPEWIESNCIQCNMCSTICPHGAIKAVIVDKGTPTPKGFVTVVAKGFENKEYRIQISPLDCTGCGCCVNVCPALNKALKMSDSFTQIQQQAKNYEWAEKHENDHAVVDKSNFKGLQFAPCHFQFSGACAGCGETAYIKMATQLFGDSMIIANATGCSSIYAGSYPACPYVADKDGRGPAWANSLFEDNAEFGLGMRVALDARAQYMRTLVEKAISQKSTNSPLLKQWLTQTQDLDNSKVLADKLLSELKIEHKTAKPPLKNTLKEILNDSDSLYQKTVWIIGGDGWAYDIGYGGLDHVLASGQDVNILVLDSQVYSNTGGQSSKATPAGAIAKFADSGKKTAKKSLAMMALNYDNVFVAQISLGANINQALQAFRQAQAHHGPSIIVAYSPCINHGVDMSNTYKNEREAVQCGYWHIFHYSPEEQKLYLDAPKPTGDYFAFVKSQRRFANLYKKDPEHADDLLNKSKQDSEKLYEKLEKLAQVE